MSPDLPSLEDLVHAICEGTPVDWDALEQLGSETFRSQLAALRVVAGIAEVHRPHTPATPSTADAPKRFGHLEVLEHIASGAFGDVYRAWDPQLDREVALKLLRRAPDADAHADEVVDEGRLLARLRHPHIVSVYGAARIDGQVGLWMEFLRGRTLAQAVTSDGALPARKVAEIGAALCDALGAVHKAGLVHRDVKAQNVMLSDDGRVVLMDFGAGGDLRHAGLDMAGTPLYLAPEVARGAPASPQSDMYSLGVLLRYAATSAYSRDVVPPSKDRALKRLLALVATAASRDPRDRFASAEACGRALRGLLVPSRNSPTLAVVGTSLVIALGAVALTQLWRAQGTADPVTPMPQPAAAPALTLRPLWQRRPAGMSPMGRPSVTGLMPMSGPEEGQMVVTNIDLEGGRPPVTLGAAGDGVPACKPSSGVVLSPSGDQAAFSCEVSSGVHELRIIHTDPKRPAPRRLAAGEWTPLEWSHPLRVLVESANAPWHMAVIDVTSGSVKRVASLTASVDGASLSPDAQWVAFDQLSAVASERHDVFVVSARGGTPVPVAPGPFDELLPAWTPDGTGLLFISDKTGSPGLWMQPTVGGRAVGSARLLAQDLGRVMDVWAATRTGQLIYFRQTGLTRTMTVAIDADGRLTGEPAQIPTRQMGGTMMANWSPDSRRLAYQTTMTGSRSIALGVLDVSSAAERIVSVPLRWFGNPRWTQDGRHVAVRAQDFTGRDGVFLVDVESGAVYLLKLSGPTESTQLQAFQMGHGNNIVIRVGKGFFRVEVPSGRERLLFAVDAGTGPFDVSRADGSVAFQEWAESEVVLKVWSPDGTIRELLRLGAKDRFGGFTWTADGRAIIFARFPFDRSLKGEDIWRSLWRIDPRTKAIEPLGLKLEGLRDLAVSPDGRHLAFTAGYPSREPWILENYLPTSRPAGTRR